MLKLKRVYEEFSPEDGCRVLVERLWPRGIKKEQAHIDLRLKELAPSTELRQWYGHAVGRWEEFKRCYQAELSQNQDLLDKLVARCRREPVTFVFSARDETHNSAVVLNEVVRRALDQ